MRFDRLLLVSTALTAVAVPAYAQTTDAAASPAQTQAEAQTGNAAESLNTTSDDSAADTIVVTGSRIRRPNIDSAVPVLSIGAEDIVSTGRVALGDLLNEQPSLRATRGQANSTAFIGTAGTNYLDLRGLGVVSTLVLQNGRRHVSSLPGQFTVDVNTIPTELVERIDVVTGGTSAVYGSDAVAGVVNFVLKRDFDGIQATGQAGISSRGDRESYRATLTAGKNFAEDRGNIAFSAEYTFADDVTAEDRPTRFGAFRGRDQVQLIENPSGETLLGSDGIADRTYTKNVKSLGLSEGGTFIASSGTASAVGTCATAAGCIGPVATGVPRVYRFRPDGTLVEANYGTDLRPQTGSATGNQINGDGSTLRRYGQLQPYVERYGINMLGHFDVTEAFSPYFEAKYIRYDIFQQSSPTFASGGTQTGTATAQGNFTANVANSVGIPIFFDNAYLNPAAANTIRAALPAGQTAFRLQRNNLDFGSREETGYRETYRIVAGVEGDFNEDWHYDLSFNYGKFKQSLLSENNRIQQRFRLSTDAVRDPVSGQIVCRSRVAGVVTPTPPNAADAAALAADIAACVPVNLFGEGNVSQAALDYFNADTTSIQRHEQIVVNGFVTGDSSQLFELPGGPVGFAIGAEYRQEDGFRDFGDLVTLNRTFLTALSRFTPPEKFEVKEAFGELNLPLLAEMPFAHELSLQGAARVADYKGAVGSVLAWNAGGTYAPIPDIRFRANYAVAVRAPTQFNLYSQLGQNFAQLNDPCDVNNINNGTATRAANCAAAGIPAGFVNAPARASSTSFATGGNPLLTEETSKSWTIGAVVQPRFLPGFSMTVDYYDIEIEDVIGSPTAQQILNACYDAPDLNNTFCAVIRRDPTTRFFSTTAPEFGLIQGGINYSKATARGVDFEASYQTDTDFGRFGTRFVGTKVLERNDYPFINEPNRPDQLLLEVGDPAFRANWSANLQTGKFNLGYQGRYIGKQAVASVGAGGGIEDIREVGGRPPQNADFADIEWIPDVFYHDIRVGYDLRENVNFYAGVDNLFDRQPPLGLLGNGSIYAADAIFDNIGRYFYGGVIVKFKIIPDGRHATTRADRRNHLRAGGAFPGPFPLPLASEGERRTQPRFDRTVLRLEQLDRPFRLDEDAALGTIDAPAASERTDAQAAPTGREGEGRRELPPGPALEAELHVGQVGVDVGEAGGDVAARDEVELARQRERRASTHRQPDAHAHRHVAVGDLAIVARQPVAARPAAAVVVENARREPGERRDRRLAHREVAPRQQLELPHVLRHVREPGSLVRPVVDRAPAERQPRLEEPAAADRLDVAERRRAESAVVAHRGRAVDALAVPIVVGFGAQFEPAPRPVLPRLCRCRNDRARRRE